MPLILAGMNLLMQVGTLLTDSGFHSRMARPSQTEFRFPLLWCWLITRPNWTRTR